MTLWKTASRYCAGNVSPRTYSTKSPFFKAFSGSVPAWLLSGRNRTCRLQPIAAEWHCRLFKTRTADKAKSKVRSAGVHAC